MAIPDIPLDAWWGARVRPQFIRLHSGDDRTLTFSIRDRSGTAVSITGTYSFVVGDSDAAEFTKTGAVSSSSVAITIAGSDTADIDGSFQYELTITETSSGASSVSAFGKIDIREDI